MPLYSSLMTPSTHPPPTPINSIPPAPSPLLERIPVITGDTLELLSHNNTLHPKTVNSHNISSFRYDNCNVKVNCAASHVRDEFQLWMFWSHVKWKICIWQGFHIWKIWLLSHFIWKIRFIFSSIKIYPWLCIICRLSLNVFSIIVPLL